MSHTERRRAALLLAAVTDLDVRTTTRAVDRGPQVLKSHADQERVALAARELGITLPVAPAAR